MGIAVFTAAAWAAVATSAVLAGGIVLAVLLGLVLAAGLRALRIGGHHGDALALAAAAATIHWHVGLALVPVCVALGTAAHIAGDELTHGGCPLAWPFSGHEFYLLPLRFTTRRFAERWIISTVLVAALVVLLWRDASAGTALYGWTGAHR